MNNKAFTISIALAALAVFMIYSYITSKEQEIKANYGTETAVIVAKRDISEMSEIYENMLEQVTKPKKFLEPNAVKDKKEVMNFIAAVTIHKGEQITFNKVLAPGVRTGLSKQISPGKRAISLTIGDDTAVTRLIKPGDRVDVVATIDPPGGQKGSQIAKVVMQDVPVLAVGEYIATQLPRKIEKDEVSGKETARNLAENRNFNTITLETDPQMALQLTLLRDTSARLSLLLRNNDDTERVNLNGMMLLDVLGGDGARVIRGPAAAGPQR